MWCFKMYQDWENSTCWGYNSKSCLAAKSRFHTAAANINIVPRCSSLMALCRSHRVPTPTPHPSSSTRGKAGRNHFNEEITPLLSIWIGERYSQSQTMSNLRHAVPLRRCELPPWRKMEQPYSPNLSDLAKCVILCTSWLQSHRKVSWICDLRTTLCSNPGMVILCRTSPRGTVLKSCSAEIIHTWHQWTERTK
jgi:hypothetical protein